MLAEVITRRPSKRVSPVSVVHVARLAGVSNATVSRVFSEAANVNHETRKKVIEAAEKLNYTPNPLARGLRGQQTNMTGIIWSQASEPSSPRFLYQLGAKLESRGYMTSISEKTTFESELKALNDYASRCVDGVIMQLWVDEQLSASVIAVLKRFKAVLLVSQSPVQADFDQLIIDRTNAYRSAARHFAKTGRRKIAFLTDMISSNRRKYNAFREELLSNGVLFHDDGLIGGGADGKSCSITELSDILNDRFTKGFPFDAVMCTNDIISQLLMHWLSRKGYKVPEDVAIVGFDNTEICPHLNPPLASVDRITQESVEEIDRMFMLRMASPELEPQVHRLSMKFLWRESAGK